MTAPNKCAHHDRRADPVRCGLAIRFPLIDLDLPDGAAKAPHLAELAGNLNSMAFDFVARQKVQGQHLNWFIVEQLPIIPPRRLRSPIRPQDRCRYRARGGAGADLYRA